MIHLRSGDRPHPTFKQYFHIKWLWTDDRMDEGWTDKGWFRRNPFCNCFQTVIGVNHLPRVTWSLQGEDSFLPGWGFQLGMTLTFRFGCIPVLLPMISYRGVDWEWLTGWKMNGGFSPLTFRRSHAKNATDAKPE